VTPALPVSVTTVHTGRTHAPRPGWGPPPPRRPPFLCSLLLPFKRAPPTPFAPFSPPFLLRKQGVSTPLPPLVLLSESGQSSVPRRILSRCRHSPLPENPASECYTSKLACPSRPPFLPSAAGLDASCRGTPEHRQRETTPPHRLATATPPALELIDESPPRSSCPTHSPASPHAHPCSTAASSRTNYRR
jgi:hypothetical protein